MLGFALFGENFQAGKAENSIVFLNGLKGTFFYHPNHLGSVSLITDVDGNIVNRVYYKPYGEIIRSESSGPDIMRYKYTGQEEDAETGLMYYGARYYDPALGRFITADTIVPQPSFSQSYNRYSYVNNKPTVTIDPSGHIAILTAIIIGAVIGAALGATLGASKKESGGYKSIKNLKWSDYNWKNKDMWRGAAIGAIIGAAAGAMIWAAAAGGFGATATVTAKTAGIYSSKIFFGASISYASHGLETGDWTSDVALASVVIGGGVGAIGGGAETMLGLPPSLGGQFAFNYGISGGSEFFYEIYREGKETNWNLKKMDFNRAYVEAVAGGMVAGTVGGFGKEFGRQGFILSGLATVVPYFGNKTNNYNKDKDNVRSKPDPLRGTEKTYWPDMLTIRW